jgi:hypothetical protein
VAPRASVDPVEATVHIGRTHHDVTLVIASQRATHVVL